MVAPLPQILSGQRCQRAAKKKGKAPPLGTCAATRKNGGSQWHPNKMTVIRPLDALPHRRSLRFFSLAEWRLPWPGLYLIARGIAGSQRPIFGDPRVGIPKTRSVRRT